MVDLPESPVPSKRTCEEGGVVRIEGMLQACFRGAYLCGIGKDLFGLGGNVSDELATRDV